jgi:hypothetical protein
MIRKHTDSNIHPEIEELVQMAKIALDVEIQKGTFNP